MKIIILSSTDYKEKDRIYNAISEKEYFSFRVKGGIDTKSKFIWLNNQFTVAEVEFVEDGRYKYPILKDGHLIFSPMSGKDSVDYLFVINALADIVKHMLQDEEKAKIYQDIIDVLEALKNGKDTLTLTLIFLARVMKIAGMEFEVNKCVFCGTTHDIVTFSFADGGFVCRNCYDPNMGKDLSLEQMHLLRYVFLAPNYSCKGIEKFTNEDKKKLLSAFNNYISDELGVSLLSINFLIN